MTENTNQTELWMNVYGLKSGALHMVYKIDMTEDEFFAGIKAVRKAIVNTFEADEGDVIDRPYSDRWLAQMIVWFAETEWFRKFENASWLER